MVSAEELALPEIEALFCAHVGKAPARRITAFWAEALSSRQKTRADLERHIAGTAEYRDRKLNMFRQLYVGELGAGSQATQADDAAFLAAMAQAGTLVDDAWVRSYVRGLPPCAARWRSVVRTVYAQLHGGHPPPEHVLVEQLDRWRVLPGYDAARLRAHLELGADAPPPDGVPASSSCLQPPAEAKALDLAFVDAFEAAFGRPMFVQEYFRYGAGVDLVRLKAAHDRRFQRIAEIELAFLGAALSEHDFVRVHLDACVADEDGYLSRLQRRVLMSDAYEARMRALLSRIHADMYDDAIEARELGFLFQRMRARGEALDADVLCQHVVAFKDERDRIVERIDAVYRRTLQRSPDRLETEEHVLLYRQRGVEEQQADAEADAVHDECDALLERALCASLEFHDVIKARLRDAYGGADMPPSALYAALRFVLGAASPERPLGLARLDALCAAAVAALHHERGAM